MSPMYFLQTFYNSILSSLTKFLYRLLYKIHEHCLASSALRFLRYSCIFSYAHTFIGLQNEFLQCLFTGEYLPVNMISRK